MLLRILSSANTLLLKKILFGTLTSEKPHLPWYWLSPLYWWIPNLYLHPNLLIAISAWLSSGFLRYNTSKTIHFYCLLPSPLPAHPTILPVSVIGTIIYPITKWETWELFSAGLKSPANLYTCLLSQTSSLFLCRAPGRMKLANLRQNSSASPYFHKDDIPNSFQDDTLIQSGDGWDRSW